MAKLYAEKIIEEMNLSYNRFDYEGIVNAYSEGAFRACVHELYPLFHYPYLKEKDVRHIDLIDRLMLLGETYSQRKRKDSRDEYVRDLQYLLTHYIDADRISPVYYQRAETAYKTAFREPENLDPVEDFVKIFICFLRVYWFRYLKKPEKAVFDFGIMDTDEKMLKDFRERKFLTALTEEKKLLFHLPDKPEYLPDNEANYIYFNSVVMLCRIKDFEGGYTREENE